MKAIALDMDGTILNHNGDFPLSLARTLGELHNAGMRIFFATGRTKHAILELKPEACPLDGYVAASGMGVYVGENPIETSSFKPEFVEKMIDEASEHEIYYEVHTLEKPSRTLIRDQAYAFRDIQTLSPDTMKPFEQKFVQKALNDPAKWVDEMSYENVVKIFFFSPDLDKITGWFNYLDADKSQNNYELYTTSIHNAEIMLKGRDKATGLNALIKHYTIDFKDVHAIGDSMNDLAMFRLAGMSTAMKNAGDNIKACTDDVTEYTCDEDGLERYLRQKYL